MKTRWIVAAFAILATALVAVGLFWTPLGAVLGGLILLGATSGALLVHPIQVRQRTALVVTNRFGDRVVRLIWNPSLDMLWPWQSEGLVLNTGLQALTVTVEDVRQSDFEPTPLNFEVVLDIQLRPETLSLERLGLILPRLNSPGLRALVEYCVGYCLRRLVRERNWHGFDALHHDRLESQLRQALQGQLATYGISVVVLQVVIRPPAGLYQTMTTAEQQRVGIGLERERLAAQLGALAGQSEPARSLAILELARSFGSEGHRWIGVNLEALLGEILGGNTAQASAQFSQGEAAAPGTQTPGWAQRPPVQ